MKKLGVFGLALRSQRHASTPVEGRIRGHDLRLQYLEAPLKVVLRKFTSCLEFWRARDEQFRAAKSAFAAAFVAELREHGHPATANLVDEAETILADNESWVIVGIFRTGGAFTTPEGVSIPDALLRLQPGEQGQHLGFLLSQIGRQMDASRMMHTDRPRKEKGAKGKGKGKAKPGDGVAPGKGKGKQAKGAQPKRAGRPEA